MCYTMLVHRAESGETVNTQSTMDDLKASANEGKPKGAKGQGFEVNIKGLQEIIGGGDEWRHPIEIVANVFDEYNGYVEGKKRPTFCEVTFTKEGNSPAVLTVTDDGAGFDEVSDIWTFFRTTEKRSNAKVSGRFNAGEKQLVALAKKATIVTGSNTVEFVDGKRKHTRHRKEQRQGTQITATLAWKFDLVKKAIEQLESVIAPEGLIYTVNGKLIANGRHKVDVVNVSLPTVVLSDVDGTVALRHTTRKSDVSVIATADDEPAWLYELGVPVCEMAHDFPYSLNVSQKVPVPMSRDMVSKKYIERLIGLVIEAAPHILNESDADAEFIKPALEYVQDDEAVAEVAKRVFPTSLRWSSNSQANAYAALGEYDILSRGKFGKKFSDKLDRNATLPTTFHKFEDKVKPQEDDDAQKPISMVTCPECNHSFEVVKTPFG